MIVAFCKWALGPHAVDNLPFLSTQKVAMGVAGGAVVAAGAAFLAAPTAGAATAGTASAIIVDAAVYAVGGGVITAVDEVHDMRLASAELQTAERALEEAVAACPSHPIQRLFFPYITAFYKRET